jgi:hypothetical protein
VKIGGSNQFDRNPPSNFDIARMHAVSSSRSHPLHVLQRGHFHHQSIHLRIEESEAGNAPEDLGGVDNAAVGVKREQWKAIVICPDSRLLGYEAGVGGAGGNCLLVYRSLSIEDLFVPTY